GSGVVIVAAPMGFDPTRPPGALGRSLRGPVNRGVDRAIADLRATGREVIDLRPGPVEVTAHGLNAMRDHALDGVAVAAYDAAARALARPRAQELLAAACRPASAPAAPLAG